MRSRIRAAYPETVMLFYVDDEKQRAVSDVMEKLSVRVIVPEREKYGCTVGYLAGYAGFSDSHSDENGREGELMIFAGISSKRLDTILAALRKSGISVRFKAVVTAANRSFTIPELMEHMYAEEASLKEK